MKDALIELMSNGGKVSHKRVVTIISTLLLSITCLTVWIKGTVADNLMLTYALIAFISALVGITAGADNRSKRIEREAELAKPEDKSLTSTED